MSEQKPIDLRDILSELSEKPSDQWVDLLQAYGLTEAQRREVLDRLNASHGTSKRAEMPTIAAELGRHWMRDSLQGAGRIESLNRFFEQERPSGPRYRVMELISRGGMGDVYRVEQRFPVKRTVAMKLIRPGFDTSEVIARFESERQALARMDHACVAKVLDAGADDLGRPYFVMEYVPGVCITQFADDNKLSLRQRLELFMDVCSAIAHAHSKAIIHRDIKASNVLAYFSDGVPTVKVIDFGVAKALTGDRLTDLTFHTERGHAIGTYESMSPEQVEGSPDIDTRTDVYSLGVLLYELLTGVKPFDRETFAGVGDQEIRRIICEVEPPRPSTRLSSPGTDGAKIAAARRAQLDALTKQLRSELEWIPLMAMRKERDHRYASPLELSADIRNYLENRPLRAGPESFAYRARKYVARHGAALGAIAAMILLLLAAVAISTGFAIRAGSAEKALKYQLGEVEKHRDRLIQAQREVELNLARSLVAEGDYRGKNNQPAEARQRYLEAFDVLGSLGLSQAAAKARLVELMADETPLMGSYAWTAGAGGFAGHTDRIDAVAVSRDGRTAMTASEDRTIRLWDLRTGRMIRRFAGADGHSDSVTFVALAPDDHTALSASNDGAVKLWNLATGECKRTFPHPGQQMWVVAYSPDGSEALCGGRADGASTDMYLWDLSAGKCIRTFRGHTAQIAGIAFSRGGRQALSASHDGSLRLWDVQRGREQRAFHGHAGPVNCVAFSPDEVLAVSAGFDGSVRLWDVATGGMRGTPMEGHRGKVWRVQFSPDGRYVASAGDDGTVRLWDVNTQKQLGPPFTAGEGSAMGVAFLQDSSGMVSSRGPRAAQDWSADQSALALWQIAPARSVPARDLAAGITCVAVSGDRVALLGTDRGTLVLWDARARKTLRTLTGYEAVQKAVRTVALARDGRRALSGGADGALLLWDLPSGKALRQLRGHVGAVNGVAFLPGEAGAVSCGDDRTLRLWDLESGRNTNADSADAASEAIATLSVSPDGRQAITASIDGEVRLWALASGRKDRRIPCQSDSVAWSPDGRAILSTSPGYETGGLRLGDARSGWGTLLYGHKAAVTAKVFSPDGSLAMSGDGSGTIILWDIASRIPFKVLENAHPAGVTGIAFSPDGDCAVSVGADGTVRTWDFDRAVRQRELERRVRAAREALANAPDDPTALNTLGEWYAFRGKTDWAVEFLVESRKLGAAISSLALAQCYWERGNLPAANAEFRRAMQRKEASAFYLDLCLEATSGRPATRPSFTAPPGPDQP